RASRTASAAAAPTSRRDVAARPAHQPSVWANARRQTSAIDLWPGNCGLETLAIQPAHASSEQMATAASSDPAQMSASELLRLYRRKQLSPVEAVQATLARIERFNPVVNAYCHLDAEGALAAAREAEARWMAGTPKGLVDGVPLGVKDNIAVIGMPSRFGSRLTSA